MGGTGTGLQPPSAGRRDWTRSLSSRLRSPTGREGTGAWRRRWPPSGKKEELQYILAAHRTYCTLQVKVEQVESEGKQESPAFFDNLEKMTVKPQRPVSLSLTPVTVKNIE